jgi:hypothetical protein
VKHNYGKCALAEKVNVEDGDFLFTTMKDAKLHLLNGFTPEKTDEHEKENVKKDEEEKPSVQDRIDALNKEKMQCLTRIRQINKELSKLQ